jgi:hypothetical protein
MFRREILSLCQSSTLGLNGVQAKDAEKHLKMFYKVFAFHIFFNLVDAIQEV